MLALIAVLLAACGSTGSGAGGQLAPAAQTVTALPTATPAPPAASVSIPAASVAIPASVPPLSATALPLPSVATPTLPTFAPPTLPSTTLPPALVPTPAPALVPTVPTPNLCGAPLNPWGYSFCVGSTITSPPVSFCTYFACIATFASGRGFVMQCTDGMYSLSGGIPGSCSQHGGNRRALLAP